MKSGVNFTRGMTANELYEFRKFLALEYNDGKTMLEIGKSVGLSDQTIWRHLKKSGVLIRKSSAVRGHKEKMILALTKKGVPNCRIRDIVGVGYLAVKRTQQRHYVDTPIRKGCLVSGCKKKHCANGFCKKHYERHRRVESDLKNGLTRPQIFEKRPAISRQFLLIYFKKNSRHKYNPLLNMMLYDCGASLRQIGEIYKADNPLIKNNLLKYGIKMRSRGGANRVIWKGKNIKCSRCDRISTRTSLKTGKNVCGKCYERHRLWKKRRNEIWNNMNEHRVAI